MSDPLSEPASVDYLLSLSLQTSRSLYDFYVSYRNQHEDLDWISNQFGILLQSLQIVVEAAKTRPLLPAEHTSIHDLVETFILRDEAIIHESHVQVSKLREQSQDGSRQPVVMSGPAAADPFKRSTLTKLGKDVVEFRRRLLGTLQVLQPGDYWLDRAQPGTESPPVLPREDSAGQHSHRHSNINIDGHARVHIGDTIIHNDTKKIAELVKKTLGRAVDASLRHWLKAPDATTDLNIASVKRCAGTGEWLMQGPTFSSWLRQTNSFLWLHGFAGCGKSILCSTAIQCVFRHVQSSLMNSAIAFFFFTFNDESKRDVSAAIRALLLQLCMQVPGLEQDLLRLKEFSNHGTPSSSTLLECLRRTVARCRHVYILLDALDESPAGFLRDDVLTIIENMRQWRLPGLHLLVTSRDLPDIRDSLTCQDGEHIALKNDDVLQDISRYVSFQVDSDRQLQHWGDYRERIKDYLTQHADGVFRRVECQLRPLRRCPRSEKHLEKCLGALPQSLDKTYEQILCNIESQDEARNMLSILCFSSRPLLVDEVVEALAVDVDDLERYDPRSRFTCGADDLFRICPELIDISPSPRTESDNDLDTRYDDSDVVQVRKNNIIRGPTVRIAHFSVQEYLLSDRIRTSPVCNFALEKSAEHERMSKVCLLYLNGVNFLQQPLSMALMDQYALSSYAAQNWYRHYHQADSQLSDKTLKNIVSLLTTPHKLERWLRLHNLERPWNSTVYFLSPFYRQPAPAMYFASLLGLSSVLTHILRTSADDIKVRRGRYGTALQAASFNGHIAIVQTLLNREADANAEGGIHGSALQAASFSGHDKIVQMLLEGGAEVNFKGGHHGSALQAASYSGYESIVRMLIDRGADVNMLGGYYGSALQAASSRNRKEIVQMLLDADANVDAQGGHYGTALHAASSHGRVNVVRMLLEKGADINIHESYSGSALQTASYHGYEAVVQILLQYGADVNRQGGCYRNALQAASYDGRAKVVRMLLANGAKVNAKGGNSNTALKAASQYGHGRVVSILVDSGAE